MGVAAAGEAGIEHACEGDKPGARIVQEFRADRQHSVAATRREKISLRCGE